MLFGRSQAGPALVWREEVSKAGLVTGGREGCSKSWPWGLHRSLHWSIWMLHQELSCVPCVDLQVYQSIKTDLRGGALPSQLKAAVLASQS